MNAECRTQLALKWDFSREKHDSVRISESCCSYCADMTEMVTCPQCGSMLEFGDSYTSLQYHTSGGIGYAVCKDCHEKEIEEMKKAKR